MSITIKPKEKTSYTNEASYVRVSGQLRDDLRLVAAWSGRTQQNVGEDLLRQALDEVLPKIPKNVEVPVRNRPITRRHRS